MTVDWARAALAPRRSVNSVNSMAILIDLMMAPRVDRQRYGRSLNDDEVAGSRPSRLARSIQQPNNTQVAVDVRGVVQKDLLAGQLCRQHRREHGFQLIEIGGIVIDVISDWTAGERGVHLKDNTLFREHIRGDLVTCASVASARDQAASMAINAISFRVLLGVFMLISPNRGSLTI